MVQVSLVSALAASVTLLVATQSTAHPLDLSSPYSPNRRFLERAAASNSSSTTLNNCLSKTGAALSYPGSSTYSTVSKTENSNYVSSHPDVVAQPSNVNQVASIVKCVSANNGQTKLSPKSGGHGYAAYSTSGNVVLDFSNMMDLTVDDNAKTVTVGAGMTLGPLAKAIGAKGYALPHGTCPTVGVSGHGMGGGWGFSSRKWGWLMDHGEQGREIRNESGLNADLSFPLPAVVSFQYVDAKGNIKTINQQSTGADADIWWGVRGAGSNNFGVVTQFTYHMESAPALTTNFNTVYGSNADCAQVLLALQELGLKQPQEGGLPVELGGELLMYGENSGDDGACSFTGQYLGSKTNFKAVKKILNDNLKNRGVTASSAKATEFDNWVDALTDIMGDLSQPKTYEPYYAQSIMDDGTPGYTASSAKAITDAVQAAVGVEGSGNSISFDLNGPGSSTNAASPTGDMSFVHRHSLFFSQVYSYDFPGFDKPDAQKDALNKINAITNAVRNAKPQGTDWRAYQNYIDPNLKSFGSAYYGAALDRLKSIKKSVDPSTIFDFAQGLAHA